MDEVAEMLVDESPFLVVLAELLPVVLQKVGLVLVLVKEVIPFVHDGFKPPASDSFRFLRHRGIKVPFPLVLGIGIDVNVQSLMTDGFHRFLIPVARLQRACPQSNCFAF